MSAYPKLSMTIALVTLLAGKSLAIECYPGPVPHRPVLREECSKAISQIVYKPDQTLDPASKQVDYSYGDCNISVVNQFGIRINKAQVEHRFNEIFDKCPHNTGGIDVDQIVFYANKRSIDGYQSWDSDFPARLPVCALADRAPRLTQNDCTKAFSDIPTDSHGRIVDQDGRRTHSVQLTNKTCTLTVYTFDFSKLDVTKAQLEDDFLKTLEHCDRKCGVVRIQGGAEGPNGRVYLSFRHASADKSCTIPFLPFLK
ncbi:hypothetical protein PGT21_005818 [Puccinia graminis f. sp. tritici]|uniref:Uncharacterized protein n=2 Tax=Puccinia graminis f. sp. tritici TaxID=56615 RepID=E3JXX3_PUCGT|nr:uncharacterized protein PGTG_02359 [Puccinia graminis f. sp. tritici CRL 75-36-700-3]EFP76898.2 hypothetical protein PGTG_02359 [Puccinia graminis f. sp. tritici CRL 75-36-700-3]KAA1118784.1 hypothetical protein PGT21_005818 [Puccinia graminis f. sp. tritici]